MPRITSFIAAEVGAGAGAGWTWLNDRQNVPSGREGGNSKTGNVQSGPIASLF